MGAFTPRQRTEIYADISAQVLALAPITSTELGEVSDNIIFGTSDQIYEVYVEITNALALLSLDSTTGSDLDEVASEYPDLAPRFGDTTATGEALVTDPNVTVIQNTIYSGGAAHATNFFNAVAVTGFPSSGTLIVGVRGAANFEKWPYTTISGTQFQNVVLVTTGNISNGSNQLTALASTTGLAVGQAIIGAGIPTQTTILSIVGPVVTMSNNATANTTGVSVTFGVALQFDHGSGEPLVLATVGDRTFAGPYTIATQASASVPAIQYTSTTSLTIFDGQSTGEMDIEANTEGSAGNTPITPVSFIGSAPFVGAQVVLAAPITNGMNEESDPSLRSRIRQQRQALSSANIDAVTSALFNANNNGQVVVFAQVVETPVPNLPSIAYIDDGNGFTPTTGTSTNVYLTGSTTVLSTTGNLTTSSNQLTALASTTGIAPGQIIIGNGIPTYTTVVSVVGPVVTMSAEATASYTGGGVTFISGAALGGENYFYLPDAVVPIVTSDSENALFVFGNITLQKNGITLSQGPGPTQYQVQPNRGLILLGTSLVPGDVLVVTTITYYTGLIQQANYQLYGQRDNRAQYSGIVALGTWIAPRNAAVNFINIQGILTFDGTVAQPTVIASVTNNLLNYVNGLGMNATVALNKLISLGFVPGVSNFTLQQPTADTIIGPGGLARTTVGNIVIG